MTPHALLADVVAILDELGIVYMVVGSFASTAHGLPRSTYDLDLVIDPTHEQVERLVARLDPMRFYVDADAALEAHRRRAMFNVIEIATAWKLDLIIRKARPFSIEELARRETASILGVEVATATAEDTIVAKLEWAKDGGSDRQLDDVAGILRVRGAELDLAYIERWVAELVLADVWHRAQTRR